MRKPKIMFALMYMEPTGEWVVRAVFSDRAEAEAFRDKEYVKGSQFWQDATAIYEVEWNPKSEVGDSK